LIDEFAIKRIQEIVPIATIIHLSDVVMLDAAFGSSQTVCTVIQQKFNA
jgi:hypothetical protein